jgi:predicted AAA+ superfamily ATPase
MPEAVSAWYQFKDSSILERVEKVTKIHADLVEGYRRDFGKYAGKVDATLIESVFNSIPAQLSIGSDESVKRFKFKHVHERKSRYSDFETAIHWLNCCRLALPNYPIEGLPKSPLAAYKKVNMVKLFMFDVGLLNHMLGSSYKEIKQQNYEYKGYVAENFVQQELTAIGVDPSYSWNDARAEIEFILATDEGNIIPVEVKSGKRTRAKSLASYVEKCTPSKTFKLTGTQGSSALEQTNIVMPLYFTQYLPQRW